MPFQSEKQRRYMHANLPHIANRWEKKYGLGGMVPAHQAGILGLAEGGKIIDGQPHQLSYITPSEAQTLQHLGGKKVMTPEGIPAYPPQGQAAQHGGTERSSTPSTDNSADRGGKVHRDTARKITSKTTTTPDDGPKPHEGDWEPGWLNKDLKKVNAIINDPNANRRDKENALVWKDQFNKKIRASEKARSRSAKTSGVLGFLGKGLFTLATAGAGAGVFGKDIMKAAQLYNKFNQGKKIYNTIKEGELDLGFTKVNISNLKNKLTSDNQKLLSSLPDDHPEKKELLARLNIKTPGDDGKDGSSIKIEDIETVNETKTQISKDEEYLKMQRAAYLQYLEQQKRRKAYLDNYNQMFLANKGGLAGLFRVKNT
jgi:hypothetical protein